jgi:RNA polymerase sigma factor for flagellar operon FliA
MKSEEEQAQKAQGEAEERERALVRGLEQVRYIARQIHRRLPPQVLLDDLVSEGVLGLLDAHRRFVKSRRVKFETYAGHRVRGRILDSLRELDWCPRELRRKARRLKQAETELESRLGRHPTEAELARELGMSAQEMNTLLREVCGLEQLSLQAISPETGDDAALPEFEPPDARPGPLEQCAEAERRARLAAALEQLPLRQQQALALYYVEELTMKEIGAVLGVGESRVSQMHSNALLRLREILGESRQARPRGRAAKCAGTAA